MDIFQVSTNSRNEFVDITGKVRKIIQDAEVQNGIVILYTPHTTAGITINENADPSVPADITMKLSDVIDRDSRFRHAEGNSDSHIKSSLVGCSEQVMLENGRLALGTWQGIFFCEFDGPRTRKVYVQIIGK